MFQYIEALRIDILQYIEALNVLKHFNLWSAQYIEAYQCIANYLVLQRTLTVKECISLESRYYAISRQQIEPLHEFGRFLFLFFRVFFFFFSFCPSVNKLTHM